MHLREEDRGVTEKSRLLLIVLYQEKREKEKEMNVLASLVMSLNQEDPGSRETVFVVILVTISLLHHEIQYF